MVKQRESTNLTTTFSQLGKRNYVVILFASLLLLSLTTEKSNAQSPFLQKEPINSGLTPLDKIIDWPFTPERKKDILEKKSFEIALENFPWKSVPINQILIWAHKTWQKIPENPNVGYDKFIARRTITDEQWITNKERLTSLGAALWYTKNSFYLLFQDLSYYRQDRWTEEIYLLDIDIFEKLIERKEAYLIDPKIGINLFLDHKRYPSWKPEVKPSPKKDTDPERNPDPEEIYRKNPQIEKKKYGNTTLEVRHYDRKTAAQLLTDMWCTFWSTNLQDEETGEKYTSGYTCVEWITQDVIDGVQTLINKLTSLWIKNPHLCINWASEWYDHRMWKSIMGWKSMPWLPLLEKHAKAHGAWFTVDIRLTWIEATYLKQVFPLTSWKVQMWSTMYDYYFHGSRKNHHLHLRMYSVNNYKLLFWALPK